MKRRDFLGLVGATLISPPDLVFAQGPTLSTVVAQDRPLRIIVVANTYHEGDGLMAALSTRMSSNPKVDVPYRVNWPRKAPTGNSDISPRPRCLMDVQAQTGNATAIVEIWCLDDLMSSHISHGASDHKADAMKIISEYGSPPNGVIAFGTAGYPGDDSNNGCASIGGTVYIRDASKDGGAEHSNWTWPSHMDVLVRSKIPTEFFTNVIADQETIKTINRELLIAPNKPATSLRLIIAADAVAVSSVNIPKGSEYAAVDARTIAAAQVAGASNITSVETTHGVIRAQWSEAPFIYVTAIPNRVGQFPSEAQGFYTQEFASSHNAGIALKHTMPHFVSAVAQ